MPVKGRRKIASSDMKRIGKGASPITDAGKKPGKKTGSMATLSQKKAKGTKLARD